MTELQQMRLSSGKTVWVEATDVPRDDLEPVSRRRVTEQAAESFSDALATIEDVAEEIHNALGRMGAKKPKEVSVELGVKFSFEGGVIIATGGVDANLKLTLSWTNEEPPTS